METRFVTGINNLMRKGKLNFETKAKFERKTETHTNTKVYSFHICLTVQHQPDGPVNPPGFLFHSNQGIPSE